MLPVAFRQLLVGGWPCVSQFHLQKAEYNATGFSRKVLVCGIRRFAQSLVGGG